MGDAPFDTSGSGFQLITSTSPRSSKGSPILETFGGNPYRASNTLLSRSWSVDSTARAVWLGSLAWSGLWTHHPYRPGTLIHEIVSRIRLNDVAAGDVNTGGQYQGGTAVKVACKSRTPVCHHYSTSQPGAVTLSSGQSQLLFK